MSPVPPPEEDRANSEYDEEERMWITTVFPARRPAGRRDVALLKRWVDRHVVPLEEVIDYKTSEEQAKVLAIALNEIVRQVSVHCVERGELLAEVWQRYSTIFSRATFQAEQTRKTLEINKNELLEEIEAKMALIAQLETTIDSLTERLETLEHQAKFVVPPGYKLVAEDSEEVSAEDIAAIQQDKEKNFSLRGMRRAGSIEEMEDGTEGFYRKLIGVRPQDLLRRSATVLKAARTLYTKGAPVARKTSLKVTVRSHSPPFLNIEPPTPSVDPFRPSSPPFDRDANAFMVDVATSPIKSPREEEDEYLEEGEGSPDTEVLTAEIGVQTDEIISKMKSSSSRHLRAKIGEEDQSPATSTDNESDGNAAAVSDPEETGISSDEEGSTRDDERKVVPKKKHSLAPLTHRHGGATTRGKAPELGKLRRSNKRIPGRYSDMLMLRKYRPKIRPYKKLVKSICQIYVEKIESDRVDDRIFNDRQPLPDFLYDFHLKTYGLQVLAEKALMDLLASALYYRDKYPILAAFCRLAELVDPLNEAALNIYLSMFDIVTKSSTGPSVPDSAADDGVCWVSAIRFTESLKRVPFSFLPPGFMARAQEHVKTQSVMVKVDRREFAKVDFDKCMLYLIDELDKGSREADQLLTRIFKEGDTNGDGVLSLQEFSDITRVIDPYLPEREVVRMFKETMRESRGQMTPDDFVAMMKKNKVGPFGQVQNMPSVLPSQQGTTQQPSSFQQTNSAHVFSKMRQSLSADTVLASATVMPPPTDSSKQQSPENSISEIKPITSTALAYQSDGEEPTGASGQKLSTTKRSNDLKDINNNSNNNSNKPNAMFIGHKLPIATMGEKLLSARVIKGGAISTLSPKHTGKPPRDFAAKIPKPTVTKRIESRLPNGTGDVLEIHAESVMTTAVTTVKNHDADVEQRQQQQQQQRTENIATAKTNNDIELITEKSRRVQPTELRSSSMTLRGTASRKVDFSRQQESSLPPS